MLKLLLATILFTAAPAFAQAPTTEPVTPLAIGETFTFASETLRETRRINVYVPPEYTASPDLRLPVLYMPDGGAAEDFIHVVGLLQVSIGNGSMRPFILVGIENTERRRDMTGPTEQAEDRKIAPRVGGSAEFRTFIRTELMPRVKARYRTTAETAIIGESLAGLFIVETFLREPDLFDTYIAFDPSLWWNNEKLLADASKQLRAEGTRKKTLFVGSSTEPALAQLADRLAAILKKDALPGLTWHHEQFPGETHATIYHPAALRALRLLFQQEN